MCVAMHWSCLRVYIQENGIIRLDNGKIIARLDKDVSYKEIYDLCCDGQADSREI